MKKYLLILLVAIFCLPSDSFAQQYGTPGYYGERINGSQGMLAAIWSSGKYGGTNNFNWNRKNKNDKLYIKVPCAISLRLAEVVTDTETNISTARWIDGAEYVGDIRKGVIKGKGTMTFPDGGKYVGDWSEGRRWGTGLMHYSNGDVYSGKWMWDLPHGKGTFISADGVAMTGKFQNGIPHGKFIMQAPDGRKYIARWKDGVLKEKSIKPIEE